MKNKHILALLFWGAACCLASEPFPDEQPHTPPEIGVQGALWLSIFPVEGGFDVPATAIPVRKAPDVTSPLIMTIKVPSDVNSREIEYEANAALAYNQYPGWFQIKTRMGLGWVAEKNTLRFDPIEKLLLGKMTYLAKDEWDGTIYESASFSSKRIQITWKQTEMGAYPANLLGQKWSGGQLWLNVLLPKKEICTDATVLDADTRGWVPAYSLKGNLVMWLYSRGC